MVQKPMVQKGDEARPEPAYPITSVDNALRLIVMFRDRQYVRVSDASAHLEVAQSTAHRLLAMLARHGFVRQEGSHRAYTAGPALVEAGLSAVRQMDIRNRARPVLEDLAARSGETVYLTQLRGNTVLALDGVESDKALRVIARIGEVLPAHCTAAGKALLAELPDQQFDDLYPPRAPLATRTGHSLTSRVRLRESLDRIRDEGVATSEEESEEGVTSVAVVARNGGGQAIAALAVSCPASRMTDARRREMVDDVREAARRLSAILSQPL